MDTSNFQQIAIENEIMDVNEMFVEDEMTIEAAMTSAFNLYQSNNPANEVEFTEAVDFIQVYFHWFLVNHNDVIEAIQWAIAEGVAFNEANVMGRFAW
jgi:hypothetical protein